MNSVSRAGWRSGLLGLLLAIFPVGGWAAEPELGRFVGAKQAQVREFAKDVTNPVPAMVWGFFDAVKTDAWETATNLLEQLQSASGRFPDLSSKRKETIAPALGTVVWP